MKALAPLIAPALFVLAQGVLPAGTDSAITRAGADWVQTSTGSIPICQGCRIRVNTEGNLVIRGQSDTDGIQFSLRKRVRASSSQEAALLLRAFDIRAIGRGNLVTLTLVLPRSRAQGAELSLTVPRALRQAIIASQGGDVLASDLNGEFDAETAAGRIEADRLGSNAVIKTGGGEIRLGRIAGGIRCYSGGGGIQAESCGRESWFETAGGGYSGSRSAGPLACRHRRRQYSRRPVSRGSVRPHQRRCDRCPRGYGTRNGGNFRRGDPGRSRARRALRIDGGRHPPSQSWFRPPQSVHRHGKHSGGTVVRYPHRGFFA